MLGRFRHVTAHPAGRRFVDRAVSQHLTACMAVSISLVVMAHLTGTLETAKVGYTAARGWIWKM